MTEREKMLSGKLYNAFDKELMDVRQKARNACYEFNNLKPDFQKERDDIIRKLFNKTGEKFLIEQPFRCDCGINISVGENFFANYNFIALDCAAITIGDNVMIAPNVGFYAAGHPLHADFRKQNLEYAFPITVGNNVWIGGNVVVNPGVTIGDNVVIGSGSIVTKDIPSNVVAVGNPCRVLREITDEDKIYYFKKLKA